MSTLTMFIEEGKKEGLIEGKTKGVQRMHNNGFSIEQIMIAQNVDEKFIQNIIQKMK